MKSQRTIDEEYANMTRAREQYARDMASSGQPAPVAPLEPGEWVNAEHDAGFNVTGGWDRMTDAEGVVHYRAWASGGNSDFASPVFTACDEADPQFVPTGWGDPRMASNHDDIVKAAAMIRAHMKPTEASPEDMRNRMRDLMAQAATAAREWQAEETRRFKAEIRAQEARANYALWLEGKALYEAEHQEVQQ